MSTMHKTQRLACKIYAMYSILIVLYSDSRSSLIHETCLVRFAASHNRTLYTLIPTYFVCSVGINTGLV